MVAMRPFLVGDSIVPPDEVSEATPASVTDTGPITSTAISPIAANAQHIQLPTDVSPIRPLDQPESSVERLKRQRPSEFGVPQTPVLKHRRVSAISGGAGSRIGSPQLTQSPQYSAKDMMRGILNIMVVLVMRL